MTMNLIEDMQAAGKTPTQLARDIEKALSKYIQEPIVTVIVSGGIGPYNQQVRVLGEAADPQAMGYREGMSLVDVMIAAGGLTDFADGNKAYISRIIKADGTREQFGVRLEDLLRDGDSTANVEIRPATCWSFPKAGSDLISPPPGGFFERRDSAWIKCCSKFSATPRRPGTAAGGAWPWPGWSASSAGPG
jgi:polysaccharide biosynthesis/export protein